MHLTSNLLNSDCRYMV